MLFQFTKKEKISHEKLLPSFTFTNIWNIFWKTDI